MGAYTHQYTHIPITSPTTPVNHKTHPTDARTFHCAIWASAAARCCCTGLKVPSSTCWNAAWSISPCPSVLWVWALEWGLNHPMGTGGRVGCCRSLWGVIGEAVHNRYAAARGGRSIRGWMDGLVYAIDQPTDRPID